MKQLLYLSLIVALCACNLQANENRVALQAVAFHPFVSIIDSIEIMTFSHSIKESSSKSEVKGTVSKGSLENGKLAPYFGENFTYFYKESYLGNRAFTSDKVLDIILNSYSKLKLDVPNRHFFLMELSNQHGGKMFPHKTHQNGRSVDFMMPKLKNNVPNYSLDTIGKDHYWLDFNNSGENTNDPSIKIDFDLIARHILILEKEARKTGYKISKVIIKIEYKNDLYSGVFGQLLMDSGIYIVKSLSPIINNLHDDHYHIDFEKI